MTDYYIHDGANQYGPFTLEELHKRSISKETLIWFEGLESWKPAKDINELESLFIKTPPPFTT